ncbi:MAG: efflux RND transporter periplasmic adaptor subunit [Bacteroidales bacterium]|nr:efflux RND transporter periplasmic adaptor subunit [Bacteroidales bacterium]
MNKPLLPLILGLLALSSCGGRIIHRNAPSPDREIIVRVQPAFPGRGHVTTGYVGTVVSARTATLNAPVAGTLDALPVREGQAIRKGQVLAHIAAQSVRSASDAAQARLSQAEDAWTRIQSVYRSGSVTEVEYVRLRTQVEEARAAAAAAQDALGRCSIRAPFNGIVEKCYTSKGVEVTLAEPILRVLDLKAPEIRFQLPENDFRQFSEGDAVTVEVSALGQSFPGTLKTKGVVASSLSHSYECTVSLPDSVPDLMPGMVCKVFLESAGTDQIIIPTSAVMTDMNGRYVWTATDGIVGKKYVTVDGYSGQGIVISDGLSPEDRVIVEGSRKVSTGMKVKTVE